MRTYSSGPVRQFVFFAVLLLLTYGFVSRVKSAPAFLPLTPPNPEEFNGSPDPDSGVGGERGAYITALNNFTITGLGIEADLTAPSLTLVAKIHSASNLTRGILLASNAITLSDSGVRFYDVPINFTFVSGGQYDIAIDFLPSANLNVRFFEFEAANGDPPFDVGGLVRVRDGEMLGDKGNTVLPHLRLVLTTNAPCELASAYTTSTTFPDALGSTTMSLAFDGTNYWSASGGSASGAHLARYTASGTLLGTFSPGLDFRSLFTDQSGRLYARQYDNETIYRQTTPGVFVPHGVSLAGGPDAQASVVLNGARTEYIALSAGIVTRWDLTGALIGTVSLNGFGTINGESSYPQSRGIASSGEYWLTYNGLGVVSFWNQSGTRVHQATLQGVGNNFDASFSFSFCNGQIFVVDGAGVLWRGFSLCNQGHIVPTIVSQPQSQTVSPGDSVTFSVSAAGTPPLSYQWYKNDVLIPNATGSTYTISPVQPGDAGNYRVRISNSFNESILSDPATLTVPAPVSELTLNAVDGGWYDVTGFHDSGNLNYFVGDGVGGSPLRNWFLFSIPPLPGPVLSAQLRLNTYEIHSPTGSETYQLHEVHTPAAALRAGGSGKTAIYADLGDGTIYGNRLFTISEAQQTITVPLNAALTADVTAAAGQLFAIGGEISSLDGIPENAEAIFWGSDQATAVQLILNFSVGGGTNITTTNAWDGVIAMSSFGEPDTATYGQTFTAPQQSTLTGFSVYIDPSDDPGPIDFKFYVMAWDGQKATGSILFESAAKSTLGHPNMSSYHFDTGSLHLTPGHQYVAFVSASTLFNGIHGLGTMGAINPGTYPGGMFVYLNNGSNFSSITSDPWEFFSDWDLAFTATFGQAGPPSRTTRIGETSAGCGELIVPVMLVSEGNENALGFSLEFDPTLLTNPEIVLGSDVGEGTLIVNDLDVESGQLGVMLALANSQTFGGGNNEIIRIRFSILPPADVVPTQINFSDTPVYRQISDPFAIELTSEYEGKETLVPAGFEGDVAPRPSGNNTGSVGVTDWVQVGRFAAQLETPDPGSEFRRADCAPLDGCGDGVITMSDWVQAGRFAAGLDPIKQTGGPAELLVSPGVLSEVSGSAERTLRIVDATMQRNAVNAVSLELAAAGNENALGFSLLYDAAILRFAGASLSSAAGGATLLVNTNDTRGGRVALALALPAGRTFPAGTHQIAQARFVVSPSAPDAGTALTFGQQPIPAEIADARAHPVTANYVSGSVVILAGNSALRLLAPQRLANGTVRLTAVNQDGSPIDPARVSKIQFRVSNSLSGPARSWIPITSPPVLVNGAVRIDDPQAANYRQRFYGVVENP